MKCKTYGAVRAPELVQMSNGRVRVSGKCSRPGCDGRISKSVAEGLHRMLHVAAAVRIPRARGLGVMTSP